MKKILKVFASVTLGISFLWAGHTISQPDAPKYTSFDSKISSSEDDLPDRH